MQLNKIRRRCTVVFFVFGLFFSSLPILTVFAAAGADTSTAIQLPTSSFKTDAGYICTPDNSSTGSGKNIQRCLNNIYIFAVGVAGFVGVLMFIAAGYLYIQGNSKSINAAKEIIGSTIGALVILFSVFIILNFIDPNFTQIPSLSLPDINCGTSALGSSLNTNSSPAVPNANIKQIDPNCSGSPEIGGSSSVPAANPNPNLPQNSLALTDQQVRDQLLAASIEIKSGASIAGMLQGTVNEAISLKKQCGDFCTIRVTDATGPGHVEKGTCTHSAGKKFDLSYDPVLTMFIKKTYTQIAARSDNAAQWQAPDGAIYAEEAAGQGTGNHWDVSAPGC